MFSRVDYRFNAKSVSAIPVKCRAGVIRSPYVSSAGFFAILSLSLYLFAILGQYDPDYRSYQRIYDEGWPRDPAFHLLIVLSRLFLSYDQFRVSLCLFFAVALFKLASRLGSMSRRPFGVLTAAALLPLVLLKFHVQIREGLALAIFLLTVTRNNGELKDNVRSFRFWAMAVFSCSFHLSIVTLWGATLLLGAKRPHFEKQMFIAALAFAVYGALTTDAVASWAVSALNFLPFFVVTDTRVEMTDAKLYYWLMYAAFPLLVFFYCKRRALSTVPDRWSPSLFGVFGTAGLLAFSSISAAGLLIWGASPETFNQTIRVAMTLLAFLGIQLALTRPSHPLTWLLVAFNIVVVSRTLFYPEIGAGAGY